MPAAACCCSSTTSMTPAPPSRFRKIACSWWRVSLLACIDEFYLICQLHLLNAGACLLRARCSSAWSALPFSTLWKVNASSAFSSASGACRHAGSRARPCRQTLDLLRFQPVPFFDSSCSHTRLQPGPGGDSAQHHQEHVASLLQAVLRRLWRGQKLQSAVSQCRLTGCRQVYYRAWRGAEDEYLHAIETNVVQVGLPADTAVERLACLHAG